MTKVQTLKGFRDFLPKEMRKRQYVIDILKSNFEKYGFEPLETPALEYDELLSGKYGDEGDQLMYRFTDRGGRKIALRYDQTVPLARVASNYQDLPLPFYRYQIQPVWRAENTQKGRYREFLQCDADILGTSSPLSDAQLLACAADGLKALGFTQLNVLVNDRKVFNSMMQNGVFKEDQLTPVVTAIDKLKKIGNKGVIEEIIKTGISEDNARKILLTIEEQKPTEYILQLHKYLEEIGQDPKHFTFEPTLARGLNYYTDLIFEIEIVGIDNSVCGGGRYDNLINDLAGRDMPAAGFAYGFDRIIEAMEEKQLFPQNISQAKTKVLVTVFDESSLTYSLQVSGHLRNKGVYTQTYPETNTKMEKQMKFADKAEIPYVIIAGPSEQEKNEVTLKNMSTGEQKSLKLDELVNSLN